eukprot:jgi/Tetstr1/448823/TSEL_003791.t1
MWVSERCPESPSTESEDVAMGGATGAGTSAEAGNHGVPEDVLDAGEADAEGAPRNEAVDAEEASETAEDEEPADTEKEEEHADDKFG